jgi:hypothetical protein
MQVGIYDTAAPAHVAQQTVPIEAARNSYHLLDLGVHTLTPGMYIWIAPLNNPDQVEAVYIDRIILVREE